MRARIALENNSEWSGESWRLPAGQIHPTNEAAVQISVKDGVAIVIARYPINLEHPIQVTRRTAISP